MPPIPTDPIDPAACLLALELDLGGDLYMLPRPASNIFELYVILFMSYLLEVL